MKKISIPALKIINDGIKIPDDIRPYYNDMIEYCKEKRGGYISLTLYPPRKPRSTGKGSQNHAINGFVSQIAGETGDDFDYIKSEAKRRAIKRGYPFRTSSLGDAVPFSESDIDTVEADYLIDSLKEIADFLNIKLREE